MQRDHERMTEDEALSALIDDELDHCTRARLLDRLAADPVLRARWERHHTARAVFEGNDPCAFGARFSERVRAAVAAEPTPGGAWRGRGLARARIIRILRQLPAAMRIRREGR